MRGPRARPLVLAPSLLTHRLANHKHALAFRGCWKPFSGKAPSYSLPLSLIIEIGLISLALLGLPLLLRQCFDVLIRPGRPWESFAFVVATPEKPFLDCSPVGLAQLFPTSMRTGCLELFVLVLFHQTVSMSCAGKILCILHSSVPYRPQKPFVSSCGKADKLIN